MSNGNDRLVSTRRCSTKLDEDKQYVYGSLKGGHMWPRKEWQRKARGHLQRHTHARTAVRERGDRHRATSYRWGMADRAHSPAM